MSDFRIGLVAEGKTDQIILEAAISAILNRPFVLTLLQPETSCPFGGAGTFGGGWAGVYRWCRQLVSMSQPIGFDASLASFDLIMIHVDADVAGMRYEEANISDGPNDLPCESACPPVSDSVNALRHVVAGWLGWPPSTAPPPKWVFCIPSKCTESWLIAGAFPATQTKEILPNLECHSQLADWLSSRPLNEGRLIKGGKKQPTKYRELASRISGNWACVSARCSQAARFQTEVTQAAHFRGPEGA